MVQNERFDALKFLSETHRSLHEKRQKYEWKIIFAVLTLFVASVGAVYSQKVYLPEGGLIKAIIWVLFLSFALVTVCFLRSINTANTRNKSFAEDVEGQIRALVNQQPVSDLTFSMEKFRKSYWAFYWQAFLTIFLAVAAAILLTCLKPIVLNNVKSVDAQTMPNQRLHADGLQSSTSGHR